MDFRGWRHTHSDRIERWLGKAAIDQLSLAMRHWYGPPILVANAGVWATRGGDFIGPFNRSAIGNAVDYYATKWKRIQREWARRRSFVLATGFASYADFLSEAAHGKRQFIPFEKVGVNSGNTGAGVSLWARGNQPVAGAAAAAAPGGTVPTRASTGALSMQNPLSGDTLHFAGHTIAQNNSASSTTTQRTALLYDRIFAVAKNWNTTSAEAVTGTPTRYQNTTAGAADSAEGNFCSIQNTANGANPGNLTVCTYTDQGGAAGTFPSQPSSFLQIHQCMLAAHMWFFPLATNDTGIQALTQIQNGVADVAQGGDFVLGHPIAWLPAPQIDAPIWAASGLWDAFNLARVFDDACLALLDLVMGNTNATTFRGTIDLVAG